MVIARELVTKLSFVFDKSKLDQFEKSITSFKNNIVLTVGDIARGLANTFDFLANLAQSRIKIKDIAAFAGIASEEFLAMRIAAQQLGVQTDIFDQAIRNLTKDLKLARVGEGAFLKLVQQSAGQVRLPFSLDNLTNFNNALEDIFNTISSISDESEKLRIIQNIFKVDDAGTAQILRLIDKGLDSFKSTIENSREAAKILAEQEVTATKLQQQIDRTVTLWIKFADTLSGRIFPVLSLLLESVNDTFQAFGTILTFIANAPGKLVDAVTPTFAPEGRGFKEFAASLIPDFFKKEFNALNATTTINISVPEGTTEDQSSFMAEQVEQSIQDVIDRNTRQLISSNPAVE